MSLRTKLFAYTLAISTLVLVVSMVFYFELKNLIEPLTPQSIPLSVEKLANTIEKNHIIDRLIYRQLLTEDNLKSYVFSQQRTFLQKYYMNEALLNNILKMIVPINLALSKNLEQQFSHINQLRDKIISLTQQNDFAAAQHEILSEEYQSNIHRFKRTVDNYRYHVDSLSDENAVVTAKIAIKKTAKILHHSLDIGMITFIDAVIISLLLVMITVGAISRPINLLRDTIENMDIEHLGPNIDSSLLGLKGEVGELARSFAALLAKLRSTTVLKDELLTEIERRKEFEGRLQTTALQLQESNRDLDQFAYAASHDLRAPLRAIESLAQWIKEDCYKLLPKDSQDHIDLIIKRVHRLDALIGGILDYSRAGRIETTREAIDLKNLLSDVIDSLSPPDHIEIHIDENMPVITTSKIAITQIFLNLISNAIKYNDKPQGKIQIGLQNFGDYYQFHVMDNGCGIEPKFKERIFEIFQTLQSRDAIESSGIGLAIVKKIVEAHSGKVWFTSTPGEGSTFFFTWPIEN